MKEQFTDISSRTVGRLTDYLIILQDALKNVDTISSEELSKVLNTTSAQVRKDLSSFGAFGTRGKGYDIRKLINSIEQILGVVDKKDIVLIGHGNMGNMITSNSDVLGKGFELSAIFENDKEKIGKDIKTNNRVLHIYPVSELIDYIEKNNIDTVILAVTSSKAQEVTDLLLKSKVTGILNLTTTRIKVPKSLSVVTVDISSKLKELNFWQNHHELPKAGTL